jgi:hypothetical protein
MTETGKVLHRALYFRSYQAPRVGNQVGNGSRKSPIFTRHPVFRRYIDFYGQARGALRYGVPPGYYGHSSTAKAVVFCSEGPDPTIELIVVNDCARVVRRSARLGADGPLNENT